VAAHCAVPCTLEQKRSNTRHCRIRCCHFACCAVERTAVQLVSTGPTSCSILTTYLSYAGWMSGQPAKQREDESISDSRNDHQTGSTNAMPIVDSQLGTLPKSTFAAGHFDLAQYSALLSSTAALVAEADDAVTPTGACLRAYPAGCMIFSTQNRPTGV